MSLRNIYIFTLKLQTAREAVAQLKLQRIIKVNFTILKIYFIKKCLVRCTKLQRVIYNVSLFVWNLEPSWCKFMNIISSHVYYIYIMRSIFI